MLSLLAQRGLRCVDVDICERERDKSYFEAAKNGHEGVRMRAITTPSLPAHRGLRCVDVDVCNCGGGAVQGVHFGIVDGAVQVGVQPGTGGEA
jgi:hypothetical protein